MLQILNFDGRSLDWYNILQKDFFTNLATEHASMKNMNIHLHYYETVRT